MKQYEQFMCIRHSQLLL